MIKTILGAVKPFRLLSLVMTYLLGAGLVKYVRGLPGWSLLIQGGIFLILISLSLELLCLLHRLVEPKNWSEGIQLREVKLTRAGIAAIIATLLTLATSIFIHWIVVGVLWQGLGFLLLTLFALCVIYYLTQVIAFLKPFLLLIEIFLFVVIPPALAFFLNSDELHPYLTLVVFSLVPAYLANRLLHALENFSHDQKYEVDTLTTRIGWENAMVIHNVLILLTYFLVGLSAVWGLHWFIIWPVFLTLPIGLLEIWLMERVRGGMKPLWGAMRFAAGSVFFVPVYLIGFAFWIR
ncbi:MAG: hypothetical protein WCY93_06645 [Anaerolineaceae bacterium]